MFKLLLMLQTLLFLTSAQAIILSSEDGHKVFAGDADSGDELEIFTERVSSIYEIFYPFNQDALPDPSEEATNTFAQLERLTLPDYNQNYDTGAFIRLRLENNTGGDRYYQVGVRVEDESEYRVVNLWQTRNSSSSAYFSDDIDNNTNQGRFDIFIPLHSLCSDREASDEGDANNEDIDTGCEYSLSQNSDTRNNFDGDVEFRVFEFITTIDEDDRPERGEVITGSSSLTFRLFLSTTTTTDIPIIDFLRPGDTQAIFTLDGEVDIIDDHHDATFVVDRTSSGDRGAANLQAVAAATTYNSDDNVDDDYFEEDRVTEGELRLSELENERTYFLSVFQVNKFGFASFVSPAMEVTPSEISAFLSGESCYLISAGFGQKHPVLTHFRYIRDHYLITNRPGKAFVRFYYKTAPKYALIIEKSPILQKWVQTLSTYFYYLTKPFLN